MIEFFAGMFGGIFGTNASLATIIVAMFPIIELKGAIPVGMSSDFWGDFALTNMEAFYCSLLGSCLIVPILALLFKPIINFMKETKIFKKISNVIEEKINKSSIKINNNITSQNTKKNVILKMLGIFLFVADPFPFTGVWTGTCVGVAIGLKFWQTVFSVVCGNIVSGLLVMFVCTAFPQFSTILFFIVLGIIAIIFGIFVVKVLLKKKKMKDATVKTNNFAIDKK